MASLRRELSDYGWACEHLMTDAVPFTQEELEWIGYYAAEMTNFADQKVRVRRPGVFHQRQTLEEYAVTSLALLHMEGLSETEKDLVRLLVSKVRREILSNKVNLQDA